MITVIFRRITGTLTWPIPGGSRSVPAFSRVRNELNKKRPDPGRLPDVETGVSSTRTSGPVVMPRPFPLGTFEIYGIEESSQKWTQPKKILTRAHQPVPIWSLDDKGQYKSQTGAMFDDWAYWIHFCNGSKHTDGCIGVVSLQDFLDFADMVQKALFSKIPIQVICVDE